MDNEAKKNFGKVIKEYRLARMITQRELAKRVGVSFSFISLIENGRTTGNPSRKTIRKIASELDVDYPPLLHLIGKLTEAEEKEVIREAIFYFNLVDY